MLMPMLMADGPSFAMANERRSDDSCAPTTSQPQASDACLCMDKGWLSCCCPKGVLVKFSGIADSDHRASQRCDVCWINTGSASTTQKPRGTLPPIGTTYRRESDKNSTTNAHTFIRDQSDSQLTIELHTASYI